METPHTDEAPARRRNWLLGREGGKVAVGILLIALVMFGQDIIGVATASRRLDPALVNATGSSDVVAVLSFTPERFHNERLATYGVFAGRDGAVNRVRLRRVTPANLRRLASLAWVSRIEPLQTRAPAPRP